MTCEDCVHYEVCAEPLNADWSIGRDSVETHCDNFADESRTIKLPCRPSDTLYYIKEGTTAENFGELYVSWIIVKIISIQTDRIEIFGSDMSCFRAFDAEGIGTVCFLTRKEAEEALKERVE